MSAEYEDVTEGELRQLAYQLQGVWWFADDADNPFGVALLVVPDGDRSSYIYTISEARKQSKLKVREPAQLKATSSKNPVLNKFGWGIRRSYKLIQASLPPRLYNDAIKDEISGREEKRKTDLQNSIKVLPNLISLSKNKG